jgi:hypothetical protein
MRSFCASAALRRVCAGPKINSAIGRARSSWNNYEKPALNGGAGISFDGAVFSVRGGTKVIAFPGEGLPWTVRFRVQAKTLRRQPKRLMREDISVSVWESRIRFDSWSYEGTVESLAGREFSLVC